MGLPSDGRQKPRQPGSVVAMDRPGPGAGDLGYLVA